MLKTIVICALFLVLGMIVGYLLRSWDISDEMGRLKNNLDVLKQGYEGKLQSAYDRGFKAAKKEYGARELVEQLDELFEDDNVIDCGTYD